MSSDIFLCVYLNAHVCKYPILAFQGTCSYVLSTDCRSKETSYTVYVENRKRSTDAKVSYTYSVTVDTGNTVR